MNLASLTEKDIFEMKLKDIPLEITHDADGDYWCPQHDLEQLKRLGAIEDGVIKHRLRVWRRIEIAPRRYRATLDEELPVGFKLGKG